MLCDLCKYYDFTTLVLGLHRSKDIKLPHQPSWASLCAAAESGCEFCKLCLWTVVRAYRVRQKDGWSEDVVYQHHQRLDLEDKTYFTLSTSRLATGFYYDRSQRNPDPDDHVEDRFPDRMFVGRPHLTVCTGDPEPRLKSRTVASEVDFSLCETWLRLCNTTHEKCSEIRDQELPTRLIDVGYGSREPRLVVTRGLRGKYATLSHCWGNAQPPVTDSVSFAAYLDQIPFRTLPRTFRDAVTIVRRLGLQYLWIDCFCIVQGDQTDWEIECARMHLTFENSAFTIAAPGAADPDAGILHHRAPLPVAPYEMSIKDSAGQFDGRVTVTLTDYAVSWSPGNPRTEFDSFFDRRAWTVQERYLSSRILYFGTAQLYFECRSVQRFESAFAEPKFALTALGMNGEINRAMFAFGRNPRADRDTWWSLVGIYSNRQLTKRSDKLPALSGLASRLKSFNDDEYLAGLWRKSLPEDLEWRTRSTVEQRATRMSKHGVRYTAPSWSWMSCDHSVENHSRPGSSTPPAFQIHKAYVTLAGLDPFGQVKDGELELSGRLKVTSVRRRATSIGADGMVASMSRMGDFAVLASISADDNEEIVAEFYPDDMTESYAGESFQKSIWCLLLKFHEMPPESTNYISLSGASWTALALEPIEAGSGRVFRRLGLLQSYNLAPAHPIVLQKTGKSELQDARERDLRRRWFENADVQNITIV